MESGALNYSGALKLIGKGKPPLCLFLYGPEDYLKEALVKKAADAMIAPGLKSFNFSAFDLAESSIMDALSAAEAFPAMGGARVVVVRNADRLKRAKKQTEILKIRLAVPPPFLCLLLVSAEADPSAAFLGSFPPAFRQVALRNPSESELDGWISSRLKERGLSMDRESRRLLLALAGKSLWRLNNEFEKLCINAGDRNEITRDDVVALVGGSAERSAFALADAVGKRDRPGAALVAADLLDRGEVPVAMAGLLTWHLVRRWGSSTDRSPPGSPRMREFRRDAVLLCESDHALKRSKLAPPLAAQLLVDALTRPRK